MTMLVIVSNSSQIMSTAYPFKKGMHASTGYLFQNIDPCWTLISMLAVLIFLGKNYDEVLADSAEESDN